MSRLFIIAAVALGLASPAFAQTAADALKQAASQAATQAVTDGINKAAGVDSSDKADKGNRKAKKDKDGPNWGKSEDHRQDGDHGHKGKKKH